MKPLNSSKQRRRDRWSRQPGVSEAPLIYGRGRAAGETDMPLQSLPDKSNYTWQYVMEREFRFDDPDLSRGSVPAKSI
ncbi:hypothetical protein [Bradyrhizobium pachyrhizi]|uniref:hypothetical protein n=1 Tax=Bradyrhizobium pachyrhizi TaxID=280333 RepID=UPI0012E36181|nr:hypothetical protein [Bradyrhizobium pachyrhizi]